MTFKKYLVNLEFGRNATFIAAPDCKNAICIDKTSMIVEIGETMPVLELETFYCAKPTEIEIKEHHTAWTRGYISRKKPAYFEPYKGKFGIGFKLNSPDMKATQYYNVTYFTA